VHKDFKPGRGALGFAAASSASGESHVLGDSDVPAHFAF
jgi:hypothetical protein